MMKILHLSGARIWGGNEQQLKYLAKELNDKGVDQYLFCYANTPVSEIARTQKMTLFAIDYIKPYKKAYWKALSKAVKELGPDIIHLHTSDSVTGYVLTDVFYNLKVKTVFSKKGISRKMTYLSKFKYNYKGIDQIICVSQMVRTAFQKVLEKKNREKLVVIPDGFEVHAESKNNLPVPDLKKQLNLSSETKIVGNISNHAERKDLTTWIKTIEYLVKKTGGANLHFVQIGKESKLTPVLKQKVKDLHLDKYVSFLGFQKYASFIYPQFDAFLITSKQEGGPSSVFEAFYLKCPVVSTKVGIIPEAIEHEKNGMVADVGDFENLGDAVIKLLENQDLAKHVVENAYQTVIGNYSSSVLGEKHYELYNKLLHENS
jgi:L-malate glycosyltransferase